MTKNNTNVSGSRFGHLEAVEAVSVNRIGHRVWACRCDCGNTSRHSIYHLLSGHTTSCGCVKRSTRLLHGQARGGAKTAEFLAWKAMIGRCTNPNTPGFCNWGGRGITVCERWVTFRNFFEDMGPRPSKQHSLDRIDVNGNYEPTNCRWATKDIQQHNVRSKSNTGELGICWVRRDGVYLWAVKRKGKRLCGTTAHLHEAIAKRDEATKILYGNED